MNGSEPQVWVRPDGQTSTAYEWLKAARPEDIAFECLRRNPDFQAACAAVRAGIRESADVCAEFGLHHFKPWDELREAGMGRPQFSATHVSVFRSTSRRGYRKAGVRAHELLLRVDLDQMARSQRNIMRVKEEMEEVLDREFKRYLKANKIEFDAIPKHDHGTHAIRIEACMQLHDLEFTGGLSDEDIAKHVPYLSFIKPIRSEEDARSVYVSADESEVLRGRFRDLRKRNKLMFEGQGYRRFLIADRTR